MMPWRLKVLLRSLILLVHGAGCLLALIALSSSAVAQPYSYLPSEDIPESRDLPFFPRFDQAVLVGYQQLGHASLTLPLGRYEYGAPFVESETVEGRLTRIAYAVPVQSSPLQVFNYYKKVLTNSGFRSRYSCTDDACGGEGYDFIRTLAHPANEAMHGNHHYLIANMFGGSSVYATTARLDRFGGSVYASLVISKNESWPTGILLQVVESQPMPIGVASNSVLAEAVNTPLEIHFASGSAQPLAGANAALESLAKRLESSPVGHVYLVGHTDNTGSLAQNLALSQQRAEAVMAALIQKGIDASRMTARGVASLQPVADNQTAAGRALNRRVTPIEQ